MCRHSKTRGSWRPTNISWPPPQTSRVETQKGAISRPEMAIRLTNKNDAFHDVFFYARGAKDERHDSFSQGALSSRRGRSAGAQDSSLVSSFKFSEDLKADVRFLAVLRALLQTHTS